MLNCLGSCFHLNKEEIKKVKKLIALSLMIILAGSTMPVFADESAPSSSTGFTGEEQVHNIQTGGRNASTGWVEVMDRTHEEASKGKNTGEHLTGVVAGGAIGVRKAIHRVGAGAIDLLTFWIPKKQPLINPEAPRLQ
jgi:putative exosortase-associated protein (TIGR04073 family)